MYNYIRFKIDYSDYWEYSDKGKEAVLKDTVYTINKIFKDKDNSYVLDMIKTSIKHYNDTEEYHYCEILKHAYNHFEIHSLTPLISTI